MPASMSSTSPASCGTHRSAGSTSTSTASGADRPTAVAHQPDPRLVAAGANAALLTMSTDLSMAAALAGVDVVHSHTWYANFAGYVASLLLRDPARA